MIQLFCLLFFTMLKCDVEASEQESSWSLMTSLANTFDCFSCCRSSNSHVIPTNAKIKYEESGFETRAYGSKSIGSGKVSIPPENTFEFISSVLYQELNELKDMGIHDFSVIRKLIITDAITDQFFLELPKLQNLEVLILENCGAIQYISVDKLQEQENLRHLELHAIFMDVRYTPGYHDIGIKISNVLDILKRLTLESFTLQASDLTEHDKNELRCCAAKNKTVVTIYGSSRS